MTVTLHPFPARMAPELALRGLDRTGGRQLRVLDPMCGSGTALTEAAASGHAAVGVDSDPLAALLTFCALNPQAPGAIRSAGDYVLDQAVADRSECEMPFNDPETAAFIEYWFDSDAIDQLLRLSRAIRQVPERSVRAHLWCALSRMIIVKAGGVSRAMDLSHSRPHRAYEVGPARPFDRFEAEVTSVANRNAKRAAVLPPDAPNLVLRGDARQLPFSSATFNRIVTSPPYLNAIDYVRTSKFSLVWMGYRMPELREVRSNLIGSEVGAGRILAKNIPWHLFGEVNVLPNRYQAVVARYAEDLQALAIEMRRLLRRGGRFTLVIGNSALRGAFINNAEIATWAFQFAGLRVQDTTTRAIPDNKRYLPPPSLHTTQTKRMREEVVILGCRP